MSTAAFLPRLTGWFWSTAPDARDDVRPAPEKRRGTPVFIHDAITPFAGETRLLSLMRDDALKPPSEND